MKKTEDKFNNKFNNIKRSCNNCQDYIVCYGMKQAEEDKGQSCPDWHLDFMIFQEIITNDKKPD